MSKTERLSEEEFIHQTEVLTQSIMNVMMLEMQGQPSSVGVFGCTMSQVLGIVALSIVEAHGGSSEEWIKAVADGALEGMKHPEVLRMYIEEAYATAMNYRDRVEQSKRHLN